MDFARNRRCFRGTFYGRLNHFWIDTVQMIMAASAFVNRLDVDEDYQGRTKAGNSDSFS